MPIGGRVWPSGHLVSCATKPLGRSNGSEASIHSFIHFEIFKALLRMGRELIRQAALNRTTITERAAAAAGGPRLD